MTDHRGREAGALSGRPKSQIYTHLLCPLTLLHLVRPSEMRCPESSSCEREEYDGVKETFYFSSFKLPSTITGGCRTEEGCISNGVMRIRSPDRRLSIGMKGLPAGEDGKKRTYVVVAEISKVDVLVEFAKCLVRKSWEVKLSSSDEFSQSKEKLD